MTPKDWNTIKEVVSRNPKLSDTQAYAYSTTWAMEGGFKTSGTPGGTWAGITPKTFNYLKNESSIAGQLREFNKPADLAKNPALMPDVYSAVFDRDLKKVGGSAALNKIGNKYAAAAMADTIFREGATGGGKIIRDAVIKTNPFIKVGNPGVIKPETLDAYSRLAKNPATLDVLLSNIADTRREGAHGSEEGRIDYFRFVKDVDRDRGI